MSFSYFFISAAVSILFVKNFPYHSVNVFFHLFSKWKFVYYVHMMWNFVPKNWSGYIDCSGKEGSLDERCTKLYYMPTCCSIAMWVNSTVECPCFWHKWKHNMFNCFPGQVTPTRPRYVCRHSSWWWQWYAKRSTISVGFYETARWTTRSTRSWHKPVSSASKVLKSKLAIWLLLKR